MKKILKHLLQAAAILCSVIYLFTHSYEDPGVARRFAQADTDQRAAWDTVKKSYPSLTRTPANAPNAKERHEMEEAFPAIMREYTTALEKRQVLWQELDRGHLQYLSAALLFVYALGSIALPFIKRRDRNVENKPWFA